MRRCVQRKIHPRVLKGLIALGLLSALATGCGGGGGDGGGGGTPPPAAPSAPTGVKAMPGNAQATLSWTAVAGATSYNVYSSPTSPVTSASSKTSVSATGATLSALANGAPVSMAVTAVNAAGDESPLSGEVCAVPTPASTTGLTLYDPLCASTLDGSKWQFSGLLNRGVSNGAMVLSTRTSNMEANSSRGLVYSTSASVFTQSGQRVTTLRADITVPAATASRTGGAELRALLRLAYQPPATRLHFPGASLDSITIQVGLQDVGNGLRAVRRVTHCDNAACSSDSSTGIAFADPGGFSGDAAASYDTTYTITVSLNEATGVFTWSIAGGTFGGGITGTADSTAYLAGNANWAALGANPLVNGFLSAQLRTRLLDTSGGSSGSMTARFDNVQVGFDNAAPTLWDDFSGTGANSGPAELRADKWTPGEHSIDLSAGSLVEHSRITSRSTAGLRYFQGLTLSDPSAINAMQADVTVTACGNSLASTNRVSLEGSFYNDGTPGTTSPNSNQTHSPVGDIQAYLFLDCVAGTARFQILRWESTDPLSSTLLSNFANSTVPTGPGSIIGNVHTLTMRWDPATHLLTFQVDSGTPVVVNPTTVNAHMNIAAPFVKPANSPVRSIGAFLSVPAAPSAVGATAGMDFKLNNVFIAP